MVQSELLGPLRASHCSEQKRVFLLTAKGMVFFYKIALFSFLVSISGQGAPPPRQERINKGNWIELRKMKHSLFLLFTDFPKALPFIPISIVHRDNLRPRKLMDSSLPFLQETREQLQRCLVRWRRGDLSCWTLRQNQSKGISCSCMFSQPFRFIVTYPKLFSQCKIQNVFSPVRNAYQEKKCQNKNF